MKGEKTMEQNKVSITIEDYMDLIEARTRLEIARDYLVNHINDYKVERIVANLLGAVMEVEEA